MGDSDKKEAEEDDAVYAIIRDGLADAFRTKRSTPSSFDASTDLRIKVQYLGEKRSIQMKRPINYHALCSKIKDMFGRPLSMYYTISTSEIIVPIGNQEELDKAVDLVSKSSHIRTLRLLLSKHSDFTNCAHSSDNAIEACSAQNGRRARRKCSTSQIDDPSPSCTEDGRFSPPPGTVPTAYQSSLAAPRKSSRYSCASSKRSEGEFIPEVLEGIIEIPNFSSASSKASSRFSTDSCCSGPRLVLSEFHRGVMATPTWALRVEAHCSLMYNESSGRFFRRPGSKNDEQVLRPGSYPKSIAHSRSYPQGHPHSLRLRNSPGSAGHQGSRASSSSSSGLVPDIDYHHPGARPPNSATSPRAPTNWKQGRCLGSGAFGQVFLCYDADTGRELAVKRVHLRMNDRNQSVLRKEVASLENEITLLKNMEHERIVQYLGFLKDDDCIGIFMEYMAGGSVKDEIQLYGPLTEKVARKYSRQITEGLNYLHHYDIVHRDIKSANILRDSAGNVKIGDFGSGKRLQTICSNSECRTFIGTPHYLAPEVINGTRYGRKADIWGLACTLVEMLTGSPPWKDFEPMAAIFRIAFESPQYRLPPCTSKDMAAFLEYLFKRNPAERPHAKTILQHHVMAPV